MFRMSLSNAGTVSYFEPIHATGCHVKEGGVGIKNSTSACESTEIPMLKIGR